MQAGTFWVVSELYYPDEQATGVFMTRIAEGLVAKGLTVAVLTSQPADRLEPKLSTRNGVEIYRSWSTHLDKNNLPGRILNLISISISIFLVALRRIKRGDLVLVVTNPPTLPFVIMTASQIKRARCIVRVEDVYPNALHACGVYSDESIVYKIFDRLMKWIFTRADAIVVLGRDMQALVAAKLTVDKEIKVITNWADVDQIHPENRESNALLRKLDLTDKLVLQWAGNMGYPHEVETLYAAMEKLGDNEKVHFLIIGAGAKRPWLEDKVRAKGLKNVTFLGNQPRSEQQTFLNACDIGLSSLIEGMTGISVPSRSYNILAAGKPILAIGEPEGEISQLIIERDLGWVVPPGDVDRFVDVVRHLLNNRPILDDMGVRARQLAETEYSSAYIIDRYDELVTSTPRHCTTTATM